MKRSFSLLCAVLVLAIAAFAAPASAALLSGDAREIHATGTGSVIGTPDRAQISLAVETRNPDVKIAQQENAARMRQVIDALIAAGIPEDALKTTGYTIIPIYDEPIKADSPQKVAAYLVTNTVTVTLHDVSRAGEIIDISVANGINAANAVQFMLSDEQAQILRTQALREAVARANADAETVSAALGVTFGPVRSVDISMGYSPVLYENYALSSMKAAAAPTPIQPGDVTVTATVAVSYLIR